MNEAKALMNCQINDNFGINGQEMLGKYNNAINTVDSLNQQNATYSGNIVSNQLSCWGYWRDYYYPQVIRESYPVYIGEKAKDKGKQAFEIIKVLKDKKLIKLEKVSDFIDAMDELIKIL